jgi:hypothetical protein
VPSPVDNCDLFRVRQGVADVEHPTVTGTLYAYVSRVSHTSAKSSKWVILVRDCP